MATLRWPSGALRVALVGALLVAAGAGCGSSDSKAPAAVSPVPPAEDVTFPSCPVGQMARVGSNACTAVGPLMVPEGFEAASPAWGFRAVVPARACLATERAAIGARDCLPVDDCSAPFPPPNAKLVTTTSALDLPATLAAAAAGDTIALDEGTYPSVVIDRDVTIVGRCASKVILAGTGMRDNGVGVDGPYKVGLRSLTFRGFAFGVWAGSNASVTVEKSLFTQTGAAAWITRGASLRFSTSLVDATPTPTTLIDGILAARGGKVTVTDAEFRGIHVAVDAFGVGSHVDASRLVVSEHSPELSPLVVASEGAEVVIDHSRLEALEKYLGGSKDTDDRDANKSVPATLRIASSELIRTKPTDPSGFDVVGGSTFELTDSTLGYRARIAISAESAAKVSIVRSVIRPVDEGDVAARQVGAGIVINDGVQLSLDGTAVLGAAQSAIAASKGCHIRIDGSLLKDTWEFERKDLHKRLGSGQALSLSGDAVLEMTNTTLENNAGVAIWMGAEGSAASITRSAIIATEDLASTKAKAGLLAWSGTVEIDDSVFHGISDTAVALDQVTGLVARTLLGKGDVGFRLMDGSRLIETTDADRRPGEGEILSRGNVLVALGTSQRVDEELTLGDCLCTLPPK